MRRPRAPRGGPWVAVVGARPNFVKLAPLVRAARAAGRDLPWLHTGQHADPALGRRMEADLGLPPPLARLRAPGPGPARVARMAEGLRPRLEALAPSLVVVLGDVDSTVAGAVAARSLGIPVAHVEAGLRCAERRLPEEQNRRRVDRLASLWHTTEPSAARNLRAEGAPAARVRRDGDVVADALRAAGPALDRGTGGPAPPPGPYAVATLHRQANVDDPARLARFVEAFGRIAADLPVLWPVHPRTRRRLGRTRGRGGLVLLPPLPYLRFLSLVRGAAVVATDSGGLQVETSVLGVPCVTARAATEHLLTLSRGTNRLAGGDPRRLPAAVRTALRAPPPRGPLPRDWDGRAAGRVVEGWVRFTS